MTQAEMHQATGFGPEWQVIWEGWHALPDVEHLCGGLYGPGGTYVSEYVRVRYEAIGTPGIEAAGCERCRVAWVRAVGRGRPAAATKPAPTVLRNVRHVVAMVRPPFKATFWGPSGATGVQTFTGVNSVV